MRPRRDAARVIRGALVVAHALPALVVALALPALVVALALSVGCGDEVEVPNGDNFMDPALPDCTRGPLHFFAEAWADPGSDYEIEWSGIATPSEIPQEGEDEDRFDLLGADGEELTLRTLDLEPTLVEDGRDVHLSVHQFGGRDFEPHLELIGREPTPSGDGGELLFYLWRAMRRPLSVPAELTLDWQPSMCLARGNCVDSVLHSLNATYPGGAIAVPPGEELSAGNYVVGNAAGSELWRHGDCSDVGQRFYAGYVVLAP